MTPEQFIQDRWNDSADLKAAVPFARVITGEHSRTQSFELPCALVNVQTDRPDYATNSKTRFIATVRVQVWAKSITDIVRVKDEIRTAFHRKRWAGTGYVVSLSTVEQQAWMEQPDGEMQGIHELQLNYQES
ncbi:hypothetical protein GYB59_02110 [bacterium]|nr:hypothetical protein [bacterium]